MPKYRDASIAELKKLWQDTSFKAGAQLVWDPWVPRIFSTIFRCKNDWNPQVEVPNYAPEGKFLGCKVVQGYSKNGSKHCSESKQSHNGPERIEKLGGPIEKAPKIQTSKVQSWRCFYDWRIGHRNYVKH